MALTAHQRRHTEKLLDDANDLSGAEQQRVRSEAQGLLNGTDDWPDSRLVPSGIHDWVEKPETRGSLG